MEMTNKTPYEWATIAGITKSDIKAQKEVFETEFLELKKAMIEVLDALSDMAFVDHVLDGFGDSGSDREDLIAKYATRVKMNNQVLLAAFNEVVRSNFSKFCKSTTMADMSVLAHQKKGITAKWRKEGEYYVIYSPIDQGEGIDFIPAGKILKGMDYTPPDLEQILFS